ncbi:hypothetical protein GCN74_00670 [Janthinobacterium sp. FT14W]|uniref:hypothetical protein n=1 Tax=Janthinobacterium sp. FT14W TaxID=2654253 RepID=UPI0012640CCC|nr:hypothetical protein [Janthinobacterium sp. FT14W]KAB8062343.1 hypothetical protein GCN74_00670 [Janthinobacterium sp. FT14W]
MTTASLRNIFLKNAVANVIGGIGSALFNLLLPALVVRYLGKLEFSVWSLALQVLIYLQLFGFGLQTAMTKFIAHAHELNDLDDQRKTMKAGLVIVTGFVFFAMFAVSILVIFYPLLFKNIPPELIGEFRICILLLGISAAWQLFALIPMGVFVGLHRNIIPVSGQLFVRMFSLLALWLVLKNGAGLLVLSLTMAVSSALIVPINFLAIRRWASALITALGPMEKKRFGDLLKYCGNLAIWNIAMLLVNGMSIMIVGHFDFKSVAAYSLASTVIAIMIGLQQAIISPLLPAGAKLNAREETRHELPKLMISATRICIAGLILSVIGLYFFGVNFLQAWLGKGYSEDILKLLSILAIANMVRNIALPYSMLLLAINMQKQVRLTVFVEGVVTLLASIALGYQYGAFGVAYGALIGSVSGFFCNYMFNFSSTRLIVPDIFLFTLKSGVFLSLPVAVFVLVF